ncbi:MAG: hypothetical protein AAGA43_12740 [Bacteroidota bacterium]
MDWLVVIPKKTNLEKLKAALSTIEAEFADEVSLTELDETDFVLEVKAGADFPKKLEDIDASLKVYPNSQIDLY